MKFLFKFYGQTSKIIKLKSLIFSMNQKKFYTKMRLLFQPQLQNLYYLIMQHLLKTFQ